MTARRGSNEGSIYQTKDGRWRGAVTLPDGRRKYLSGPDRKELARRVLKVQREVDSRLPVSTNGRPPTLAEWLDVLPRDVG